MKRTGKDLTPFFLFVEFKKQRVAEAMADVFISYTKEDGEKVQQLAEALEAHGLSVWWDRDFPKGKDYDDVIEAELDAAGSVVLLWSEQSKWSNYVIGEAREAHSQKKLIPAFVARVKLPMDLRAIQGVSLTDWDGTEDFPEIKQLVGAIERLLENTQHEEAEEQKRRKEVNLAREAKLLTKDNPVVAGLLAIEASRIRYSPDSDDALRTVLRNLDGRVVGRHAEPILRVTLSTDGNTLVSSGEKSLRVWDLSQSNADPRDILGNDHFAISADGTTLVSGDPDNDLHVCNLSKADINVRIFPAIGPFALSADGTTLAGLSPHGFLRVWDLSEPDSVSKLIADGVSDIEHLMLSANGKTLAASAWETVEAWNLDSPAAARRTGYINEEYSARIHLCLGADGRTFAFTVNDYTIEVWDLIEPTGSRHLQQQSRITALAVSTDGHTIISGGSDSLICVWDSPRGEDKKVLSGHGGAITSLSLSPDASTLVSGSSDQTVRVWQKPWGRLPKVLRGHEGSVDSVALSSDGKKVISGSSDATVRAWDFIGHDTEPRVLRGLVGEVETVAISTDGRTLASGGLDSALRVWKLSEGENSPELLLRGNDDVDVIALSADGSTVVSVEDGLLFVWDLEQSECKTKELHGHRDHITAVALSADGSTLASASKDQMGVWDLGQPEPELQTLGGDEDVRTLALSGDGKTLVSGRRDHTVRVWDLTAPMAKPTKLVGGSRSFAITADGQQLISSPAISGDGKTLASFDQTREIQVWDLTRPEAEPRKIQLGGGAASVLDDSVRASPSRRAAYVVEVWDLARPETKPRMLHGHEKTVRSIALSGDGKILASGSADQTVRVWRLDCEELIRLICSRTGRNLHEKEEWPEYFPDDDYRESCPQPGDTGGGSM